MTAIPLTLPQGSIVAGEILRDYGPVPERLSEDILQVTLPSGVVIDVGWYPRFDPAGTFRIVAFEGDWDNQIVNPIETAAPPDAAAVVEQLAKQYARKSRPIVRTTG